MRKMLGFLLCSCSICLLTLGCGSGDTPEENEKGDVRIEGGNGEGLDIHAGDTDVHVGGGEGVQVETND